MTEVRRILNQYDRVMNGDAWHGDPIWQILDGISAEKAALRPIANAHSIWESRPVGRAVGCRQAIILR